MHTPTHTYTHTPLCHHQEDVHTHTHTHPATIREAHAHTHTHTPLLPSGRHTHTHTHTPLCRHQGDTHTHLCHHQGGQDQRTPQGAALSIDFFSPHPCLPQPPFPLSQSSPRSNAAAQDPGDWAHCAHRGTAGIPQYASCRTP